MKKIILYALSVILSVNVFAQTIDKELSQQDRDNLIKTHNTVTEAAHMNPQTVDWNVFVKAHYTEDAILMPPNAPISQGINAIVAVFKSFPTITKFQTHDVEVEGSGNLAFIRGTYDIGMKMQDGSTADDIGKYIEVWKKNDNGEWKCIRDIFNSDAPLKQ